MPNSINGVNTATPVGPLAAGQNSAAGSGGAVDQAPPAAVDSVDVGGMEALLQSIGAAADQVPTVDAARVSELQQAIAGGTYRVDAQAIAQKLLDVEGQLGVNGGAQ